MNIFQAVLKIDRGDCKEITNFEGLIGLCDNFVEVASILGVYLRLKCLVYALEQKDHLFVDETYHPVANFRKGLDLLKG